MYSGVVQGYRDAFACEPEIIVRAPGRINLMGEHTDYSGGWVLPCAIDLELFLAAGRSSGESEFRSDHLGPGEKFFAGEPEPRVSGWAAYPAGVAWALGKSAQFPVSNIRAYVLSEIPIGAGVSSSAALEVASAFAWNSLCGLGLGNAELASLCTIAENEYVGVRCGVMDQLAVATCEERHALLIQTETLVLRNILIPPEFTVILCYTGFRHDLLESGYNDRRREVDVLLAELARKSFRNLLPEDLLAWKPKLDEVAYRRLRHIVMENQRCKEFAEALLALDRPALTKLAQDSHESLRDDFNVSCPAIETMFSVCSSAPGCIAVRMTGGGFGGSCVAIVDSRKTDEFKRFTDSEYRARAPHKPLVRTCQVVGGVSIAGPDL